MSTPVEAVPPVALLPDQAPEAVQLVALVLDHVSVDAPPLATLVGEALKVSVGAGRMVTLTLRLTEPPAPLQLSVKVESVVSAPVEAVPLTALVPDHAPEARQLAALVVVHVSVDALPLATLVGEVLKVSVGGAMATTAVCVTLPPGPLQLSVKVESIVSAPVEAVPLSNWGPLHAPEAVQLAALVVVHVSVDALPLATLVGEALKVSVGGAMATTAVCVTLPPGALQLSVKVESAVSTPVEAVPPVALLPDQAPDARQLVALVLDHVSVDDPPLTMVVGEATRVSVGGSMATTAV